MRSHWGRNTALMGAVVVAALFLGCQSTYVRSAKIYMQQDQPDNAKKILLEGSVQTPDDPELWYILGKVDAELEQWDDMNDAFAKAEALTDAYKEDIANTRYEAWRREFNGAVKPFNNGDYAKSLDRFLIALKIRPGEKETLKRIGLCYLQSDSFKTAETYLQEALHMPAQNSDISTMYNLLMIYRNQERWKDVTSLVDTILAVGGETLDADRRLDVIQAKAIALQKMDRKEDAIAEWDQAIASDPDNPDFHYNKAILLHTMTRYAEAAKEYLKAIDLNPSDNEARLNASRALLASQDWPTLEKILEPWLFPDGVKVYDPEMKELDPWLILRASYENLKEPKKVEVVNQILIKLQTESAKEEG